jgi:hypothetical protein
MGYQNRYMKMKIVSINSKAGLILITPIMGLVAITRNGQWNWNIIPTYPTLNMVFWFGWTSSLIVGIIMLFKQNIKKDEEI